MSETPETNALLKGKTTAWNVSVDDLLDHARRLERERDELKRWTSVNGVLELQRERDEWKRSHDHVCRELSSCENARDQNAEMAEQARAAIRNLRDAKGRHHTQQAAEKLFALLPESQNQPNVTGT